MSQVAYQVKKQDGSVHGPYSIAVIRAFLMSGKFSASDSLLAEGSEEPIFRSTEFQDLFQNLPNSAAPPSSKSERNPLSLDAQESVPYPYPLDSRAQLSREQLLSLLAFRENQSRQVFYQGQLLPPDVKPAYGGSLGKLNILKLLSRLYSTKQTGRVHIRKGRETVDVFFEKGELVYAASSLEKTRLGQILLQESFLSREEMQSLLKKANEYNVPFGYFLLKINRLPASLLVHAFNQQFSKRIFTACGWRSGLYRFYEGQTTGYHFPIKSNTPLLFKETVSAHISSAVIQEHLYSLWNRRLIRLQHPRLRPELFHLDPNALRFVKNVNNDAPLRDLFVAELENGHLTEDVLVRLVYLMWQVDMFAFKEELMGDRTRKQLDELDEKIAEYKHLGMLQRLSLQPEATKGEIRSSYLSLAKQYHPDQQPAGTHSLVLQKMEVLFAMIAEAYRILR